MAETNDVYDQVFSCIASGSDYTQNSKIIFDQLAKKAVPYTKNFVSALFDISNTPDYPANTKFYALYLLVKATETKNKVLIEQLVKNSEYMNKLFTEAQTDRSKPLGEKGKKLFSKTPTQEDAMIGRNYMILLLEALSYWNKEYGSTKKSEVGYSFNAIATTLSTKIPLPTTYHYIGQTHRVTDNFHLEPAKAQALEAPGAGTGATPQGDEDLQTSEAFLQLISCISSEDEYVGGSKMVFSSVEKNNQTYNKTLLKSIYEVLSKPEYGNNLKFHSLYLLGQLLETENKVFVSQVAQETKLLNHLAKEGATIGKNKPTVSDDKNPDVRYKKNSQVLLLEIVRFTDSKYGSTDTKNPYNNFKVLYTSLAKKTTFPEEYLFINTNATGKGKKSVKIVEEDKKAAPMMATSQTEDPFMKQVQACIASGPAFADGHAAIVNTLNQSTEEKVLKYFDGTLKILNSPEQTPKSKFYALYLITKASETNNGAGFVTVFTHSKGLMDKLFQDAQFDAKKAPEQRGANYFSKKPTNDESVIGNNYIELLAETFKFWGEDYGTDNKKSPLHILNAINGQLSKTTKIPEQYYYVRRNLNSLDSKDLSRFELIPYKNLPKSAPKNAAAPANPSVSGNKPVITVNTPKPQEETKRPDDLNMKSLENDMNKLAQSKLILAEFLESNDDENVDGQLVSLMFQDVGSIYNNEILMHVDPLVDSTHPDKDKYMNLIFKEGDVQDKLDLEHNNFLQGKISYTELRRKTLPLLVAQDPAASSVKGSKFQESKDVSVSKASPQIQQHNHAIDLEEEKIAQAYMKKSQASDLMYSESEKASPQVPPKMMQSHASDLIQDHDSQAEIADTRSRPPAPRSQKVDLESEEEKKTSKRSPSPKVITQKFSAGDLMADKDSAGLKPKPKEQEKEKESVRPKVVPQKFQSGELIADPDSSREVPAPNKVVARSPSYKVVKQKFLAGDLLNDVDQPEVAKVANVANIAHTQSVMFSPPKKPVGAGSGEKEKLGQSVRISPSKDYNMEISKIGQSIKMSKAKISSLSNIQDSIKKSFVNVGKEPPRFKPLPDMAAMENIEDEIIRLNKEKEELRRENMMLRDQTSNMIEDFEHKQHTNTTQIDDLKKLLNEYQDRINNAQNQLETFKSDQALVDIEREREREREIEIRTKKAREEEKERTVKPVKEVHEPVRQQVTPRDVIQHQQQQPFATPEQRKSMISQQSTSPILDSFIRAQRSSSPEKVFFPPADVRTSQYQTSYISPGRNSTSPYVSGLASGPNVKGDYVLSTPIIAAAGVLRDSQRPLESGIYQSPNVNTSPYRQQAPERSPYTSNFTGVDQFVTAGPTYSYSRSPPQPERRVTTTVTTTDHPVTYVEVKSNSALKKSPNKPSSYRHNLLSSLKLRIKDTHTAPNTVNNYKLACLQKQSVLYENQDLRIASSVTPPLYETSKRNDLNIRLEFTNKSSSTLRDFTTIFSEVYNVTLTVKNEVSNSVIEPGRTLVQQIVFSFEEWPLQVSQIYASYKVSGRREDVDVYLPTLVTQFMNFKPSDGVTIKKRFEQEIRNVVQGDEFHLNQSIIRNSDDFKRIFNYLGALDTSRVYGDEAVLGGVFKLNWQRSEYALKIDVTRAKTVTFAILAQDDNVAFADIILETLNFLFGRD